MRTSRLQVIRLSVLTLGLVGAANFLGGLTLTNSVGPVNSRSLRDPSSPSDLNALSFGLKRESNAGHSALREDFGKLPLSFEANAGQTDAHVKFLSRGGGCNVYLTATEAVMELVEPASSPSQLPRPRSTNVRSRSGILRMKLVGASSASRIIGLDELQGKSNYFIGDNPKKWRRNVPNFSRVKYENAYPGVEVVFYGKQGQLEYDFLVAPGADPTAIAVSFYGAQEIRIDESGEVVIETSVGELRQLPPKVYQKRNEIKQQIAAHYVLKGRGEVGLEFGGYDSSLSLTVDPVLVYSTYLGGSISDLAKSIAVDTDGNAYVTGSTSSINFPTANALQSERAAASRDAFVSKLNPSGTALVYSTYLGGTSDDEGNSIAVDASGSAYVTGKTQGRFPTTAGAFQPDNAGGYDAFVTKLSSGGDNLVYSTYLGGAFSPAGFFNPNSGTDIGYGIAVDSQGNAYVTGETYSPSFPIKRALQSVINRGSGALSSSPIISQPPPPPPIFRDAFVTKLNPSGSDVIYSTYLGGSKDDEGRGIAVDSSGGVYVVGITNSSNFPTARALQPSYAGDPNDAFLVKLAPSGKAFVFSTFLGGSADDAAYGVAIDLAGNAYVTGETASVNFPTTSNAFQTAAGGSPIYKSTDGGNTWRAVSAGLPDNSFNALVIDPITPTTLYAGLGETTKPAGAFKSTDGGSHWFVINNGLSNFPSVSLLSIDPKNSATLYAVSFGTLFKSTDGGSNWNFASRNMIGFVPLSLIIDPVTPTTLYSGANVCPPPPSPVASVDGLGIVQASPGTYSSSIEAIDYEHGLFKSTDGGLTWNATALRYCFPSAVAIDPKSPSTVYASAFTLFRSTDGGNSWIDTSNPRSSLTAIDPINPSTLYAATGSSDSGKVIKSTDSGLTWRDTGLTGVGINAIAVDPMTPSNVYAGASNLTLIFDYLNSTTTTTGFGGGVFKSTNGGNTWSGPTLVGATVQALVIDPLNPSTLYAGAFRDSDAFVTKINAQGSALVYSSLLGGIGRDAGLAIAVDSKGRAYITGDTFSASFPTRDAIQANKASGLFATGAFVTMFDEAGAGLVYSTHLGGSGVSSNGDIGTSIAVDAFGKVYAAGYTYSTNFPTRTAIQPTFGGNIDAFVSKIAFPPIISNVSVSGKNLIVTGENFDRDAVILVNDVGQRTQNDETKPTTVLIGKKAAKNVAPGQTVTVRVRNSDGLLSEPLSLTRSA